MRILNALRHCPSKFSIKLDDEGWTDVDILCENMGCSVAQVYTMVGNDARRLVEIAGNKIRALNGHSVLSKTIDVDDISEMSIHYTSIDACRKITKQGISPMSRTHVHSLPLGSDLDWVRGEVAIHIDLNKMRSMNHTVSKASNGTILTCCVPPTCIKHIATKQRDLFNRHFVEFQLFGLSETKAKLDDMLSSITNSSESVTDLVSNISSCFETVQSKLSCDIFNGIVDKLAGILIQLVMARPGERIRTLALAIIGSCGVSIAKHVFDLAKGHVFQAEMDQTVLVSLLCLGLQFMVGFPKDFKASSILDFFAARGRNFKFALEGFASMQKFVSAILEYVKVNVFGLPESESELNGIFSGYDEWVTCVRELVAEQTVPLATRLETDEKLWFTVDALYSKAMDIARDMSTKRLPNAFNIEFQKVFKVIEDAKKQCDASGVFGNKPRVEPLVVHLFGESGVGKSGMAWPLATDLNSVFCKDINDARDFAKNVYFRNTEQEFWDGYAGQNVVCYDDFGQRVDGTTNPNEEFMELIRASNMAPYPLHMADMVEKRRTKFISKVIMLTSNKLGQNVNSLTYPDAYRRRIDICAEVTVKDEYAKSGYSQENATCVNRLDPLKTNGPIDTNVYEVTLYDAESQTPITDKDGKPIVLDYDEFVDRCCKLIRVKTQRGIKINKVLEDRITTERFARLNKHVFQISFENLSKQFRDKYSDAKEYVDENIFPSAWNFASEIKAEFMRRQKIYAGLATCLGLFCSIWALWNRKGETTCARHNVPNKACASCEITNSGDPLTAVKAIKVEISHSGDLKTQKRTHQTEISNSGDLITQKRVNLVEVSNSGDAFTATKRHVVEHSLDSKAERIGADMQAWEDTVAQDLISTRILSNQYKVIRVRAGKHTPLLNGLFVRDTVMLLPVHVYHMLDNLDIIRIENIYGAVHEIPLSDIKKITITGRDNTYKDAVLWQFPRSVNAHCDLVKHFQKMPELSHLNARICLPTLRSSNGKNVLFIHGNTDAEIEQVILDTPQGEFHIRDSIKYHLNTTNGDCGAPVICNDSRVIRKICGIHIAGEVMGREAYAQSITQNDLISHLALLNCIITDPDQMANITVKSAQHQSFQFDVEYEESKVRSFLGMAADTFFYIGKCIKPVFTPNKTELRASVIQNMVTQATSKPAVLFSKDVDILKKNLAKCGENTPYIPPMEIESAVNSYKQKIFANKKKHLCRLLTNEEAITGSADSEFINGISRKSSPGYPWVFDKTTGKPGKTTWFGDSDTYEVTDEILNRVTHLENIARQGKRIPFIWTDTLKDERRPIAKVDALKTRVFAAGPMDYTILVRKYFLGFVANTMENRICNEQSLGTNPFGSDWALTARALSKFGKKVFAGDFSTFDGTLNPAIMHSFVDAVNEWYDDGKENALIRTTLFMDVMNSVHLCGDQFYGTTHSQPSGNPLTTILNSWYNSVSMRIAYARAAKMASVKAPRFNDVVSMVSYGDDNVINFSDGIADWFNQVTVSEAYSTFGMTYTDEAKTGNIQPFKTLEEVAYLKRGFRNANGYVYAPLDLSTILEMCNWVRDSPDPHAQCAANIDTAARELVQHGEPVFREWVPKLVSAFYSVTNKMPPVGTFAQYLEDIE